MTKDQIFEFFRRLAEDNPEPETELEYGNAYQLTVAVALSAQATDVGVNKATRALFAKVKTPQQMLDLGLEGLVGCELGLSVGSVQRVLGGKGQAVIVLEVTTRWGWS